MNLLQIITAAMQSLSLLRLKWLVQQQGHEIWLVRVAGVTSPEQAGALRNHRLLMLTSDCHELEDQDEFYSQELIGMRVGPFRAVECKAWLHAVLRSAVSICIR